MTPLLSNYIFLLSYEIVVISEKFQNPCTLINSMLNFVEFSGASMLPVPLRVDQLKLNHMYNIINGIAPSYLKSEISIAGHTSHVTRSGNRACFVSRVNSFAIKSFFYTGIKQWNALPSTTQLLTNKQAFKSEVKKLLRLKLIQMDEEVYLFY